MTSITLPDSLKTLGNYAFRDCSELTDINFGKGLEVIGRYSFYYCSGLSNVTIPDNITEISAYAFAYSSNLKTLTIGMNVKTIGSYILSGCSAVNAIYVMSETPPTVSSGIFSSNSYYSNTTLYVPKGTVEVYKEDKIWSKFEDIQEHELTGINSAEAETAVVEVTTNGIVIKNADGAAISVYNVVGVLVEETSSYTGETMMLDRGVYIIRIGEKTLKVRI